MPRLINRYDQSIDDKGRLVLPSSHRERFANGAVLANRGDHIAIYEPAAWDAFVEQLREKRAAGEMTRRQFNLVLMNAADPKVDSAGRVVIPGWMRAELDLGREVLVTGADDYLAIYPRDFVVSLDDEDRTAAFAKIDAMGL